MEQTALANKPDIPMAILDNLSDPPNKLAIAVFQVMSKCSGRWIKLVEAAVFRAKPEIPATVRAMLLTESPPKLLGLLGS